MEMLILFVLLIFMALFMGGGVLIIKGLLARKRKQWLAGLGLLLLCGLFMYIVKLIPGIY